MIPAAEKAATGAWKHGADVDTDLRLTGKVVMTKAALEGIAGVGAIASLTGDATLRLVGLVELKGGQHVGEGLKLDTRTSMISGKFALEVETAGVTLTAPQKAALDLVRVTLFVKADLQEGTLMGAVVGATLKELGLVGYISTTMNTYTQDVGFDVQDKE